MSEVPEFPPSPESACRHTEHAQSARLMGRYWEADPVTGFTNMSGAGKWEPCEVEEAKQRQEREEREERWASRR